MRRCTSNGSQRRGSVEADKLEPRGDLFDALDSLLWGCPMGSRNAREGRIDLSEAVGGTTSTCGFATKRTKAMLAA